MKHHTRIKKKIENQVFFFSIHIEIVLINIQDKHSEDRSSHNSDFSDEKTISTYLFYNSITVIQFLHLYRTSSGVKSALEVAKSDKNTNLKKLGWIMFFTTLFAMVVMFTQLGVLHRQLGRFNAVVLSLDGKNKIYLFILNF